MHLLDRVVELHLGQALRGRGLATATATVADTGRRSATAGSSDAPGVLTSTKAGDGVGAAWSMPSLIRRARATVTPSPSPGKTRALLAWRDAVGDARRG